MSMYRNTGRTYAYRITFSITFSKPLRWRRLMSMGGSRQGVNHTECRRLRVGPLVFHRYTVCFRERVPADRPVPRWRDQP